MRTVLFIILIFLPACGFQPVYKNIQLNDYYFKEIKIQGDTEVNRKIINYLSIKEDISKKELPKLFLNSTFKIEETSKDSKGIVETYRSSVEVSLKIIKDKEIIRSKDFLTQFNYNNKNNSYELNEYQNKIKSQITDKIIEDIFLYLNTL